MMARELRAGGIGGLLSGERLECRRRGERLRAQRERSVRLRIAQLI